MHVVISFSRQVIYITEGGPGAMNKEQAREAARRASAHWGLPIVAEETII